MRVVWASDRIRRWYGAAALASLGVPAVLVHAIRVADRYARTPAMSPDDTSPGGGMGYLFDEMFFVLATPICLAPFVLWLIARYRARRGGAFLRTARFAAGQLVILALLALPLLSWLPHAWADGTALAVACVVGLGAATVPPRRAAAWAETAAAVGPADTGRGTQNQA